MIALASAGAAGAIAVLALDLDDRLERSVDVFVGTVSSTRAEAVDGEPWTVVTLEVERWLRSAGDDVDDAAAALRLREQVELAFLGGDAPGVPRREVAAMPRLQLGERLLLLTHGAGARFASSIVGFDQGLFRLIDEMWIDQDGNALGFDAGGVLVLGADGAVHGEELMSALSARLVQLGSRP